MRLAAQAKMGYYPTPYGVTYMIINFIKRKQEGLIRVLDPCAGEGTATNVIGDHLNAKTYGVELDVERGRRAKQNLTKCLITDYKNTAISHNSFSLLYLNPPYDWSQRDSELEVSERYERTFLRDCVPYLCPGGILVYLIPLKRLDRHIAKILSYRFEQIAVFRFPKKDYEAFKQLVIFGKLKKTPGKDEDTLEYLKQCGEMKAVVPYLPDNPTYVYEVPVSPSKARFIFRSRDIDPEELAEEIEEHGLFPQLKECTTPLLMSEKIKPIMPLRHGHLAQILACGLMNGIVRDTDKHNPLLMKGVTRKETKHKIEVQGKGIEKHITTDEIKIIIHAFNEKGELLTIQ